MRRCLISSGDSAIYESYSFIVQKLSLDSYMSLRQYRALWQVEERSMPKAHNLGFPRIGKRRELKRALESFWCGEIAGNQLQELAADLRRQHWRQHQECGLDVIPAGDFALYDHM